MSSSSGQERSRVVTFAPFDEQPFISPPTEDQIRHEAYMLWRKNYSQNATENWLEAERRLNENREVGRVPVRGLKAELRVK